MDGTAAPEPPATMSRPPTGSSSSPQRRRASSARSGRGSVLLARSTTARAPWSTAAATIVGQTGPSAWVAVGEHHQARQAVAAVVTAAGRPCDRRRRLGVPPARDAAGPVGEPPGRGPRRASPTAISSGSRARVTAEASSTASQPSSIASAASEAVPMPASSTTGTVDRLADQRDVVRVADAQAAADRRAERHHGGAADVGQAAGDDRVVVGVGQHGEAVGHEPLGRVEQLDRVGQQRVARRRSPRA